MCDEVQLLAHATVNAKSRGGKLNALVHLISEEFGNTRCIIKAGYENGNPGIYIMPMELMLVRHLDTKSTHSGETSDIYARCEG